MADLSRQGGRGTSSTPPGPGARTTTPPEFHARDRGGRARIHRGDRAQLLLTAALVISVLFVTVAMLLNAAIFTENLSARSGSSADGHAAGQWRADATTMTAETLAHVNSEHNASKETLRANVTAPLANWSDLSGRHAAVTGATANLSLRGTTNGTHIRQTDATRNFTDATGRNNWTLVSGTDAVREYRLAVQPTTLVQLTKNRTVGNLTSAGAFRVRVTEGSDTWRVFLYRNASGRFAVAVESPSGTLSAPCTAGGTGPIVVDLPNATVGGNPCSQLSFFDAITGSRTVAYQLGTSAGGTYSLVADTAPANVPDPNYDDLTAPDGPYATDRINEATVRLTYETPGLSYRTTIAVVPGDVDA